MRLKSQFRDFSGCGGDSAEPNGLSSHGSAFAPAAIAARIAV
jgi:hypothetical protein